MCHSLIPWHLAAIASLNPVTLQVTMCHNYIFILALSSHTQLLVCDFASKHMSQYIYLGTLKPQVALSL